ncbi:MAG: DUF4125 family protein [Lachnospiraceae bacterium]|nr:DUF4125 family protein [Lachnospiraceae bacterium]
MDMNEIFRKVDGLFEENKSEEAEKLMLDSLHQAVEEQDDGAVLQLLNELIGFYRETNQVDTVCKIAAQAVAQAERMGLQGTIPYATTLLNVANAYRAVGRLQDSLEHYLHVREIYEQTADLDHLLLASLENNLSLLYQEMGDFERAKECLLKALPIVEERNARYEVAVTYANLAATRLQLSELQEAKQDAEKAIEVFRTIKVEDSHFGAALSALGSYYYRMETYKEAIFYFRSAMVIIEQNLGKNKAYYRLQDNIELCEKALHSVRESEGEKNGTEVNGMALCREYYETVGKPMLEEKFGAYLARIAVGLVGEGSDCFGYDDELSRDHDWGPGFCIWVTKETYAEIGKELEEAYEELPIEWKGYKRKVTPQGQGRRGVMTIDFFYERLLQTADYEKINWQQISDASLAAAVNGEVFVDPEGIFSDMRKKLLRGYPESIRYLKLAQSVAVFAQCGQYNYARMKKRGDDITALIMLSDALKEAMKIQHYIEGRYPPHDKWLYRSVQESDAGWTLGMMVGIVQFSIVEKQLERIAEYLATELYQNTFISDSETYLGEHVDELLQKSRFAVMDDEELVERIARLEFEAFDKVQNEGGRAECQNNWNTFSIMRRSQYLTWNRTMLMQYLYDFDREYRKGHNLITEKYGRMMESTTPERYEEIKGNFPEISPEKKTVIEQIVAMQVNWMEEFASQYPHLADNARAIRTAEDEIWDTSYETYLRGEISTYSDKMLQLYGQYVVEYARAGRNLTFAIMENSARRYGYASLDAAEEFLKK